MSSISHNVSDVEHQQNIFANNFWGRDDAGFEVLTTRLKHAKQTCEEIKNLFHERALIEEEYAKRLSKLSKIQIGKDEVGTLRDALETVRQELETTAKEHIGLSQKIKVELEQELSDFITKQREKRKLQQSVVEKSLRNKQTQISSVQKAREKYESECLKLPGLLESKKTVVGKDLEKLSLKIEKTQLAAKAADQEYMQMVKIATDATQKWNDDWRLACEKFQYLEEDRIEFLKQELWNYANLISSICVVDDESCERIRVCLENCNVDKDIQTFIKEHATGPEIPEPPSYVNFYAGSGENGTRYKRASYERTSMEYKNNVLPPGTDQPIGNSQNTNYNLISSTNSNQSSQENGMNYKTLYNFLPVEKSSRATLYANTSSASPHGTIKDSVLPQTPIEEIEEPDPIDPRQQTILAVGENMLEVQTTNEDSSNDMTIEQSIEKALDDLQNKEKEYEKGKEYEDENEDEEEKETSRKTSPIQVIENDLKSGSSSPIANTVESVEDMPQLNNQQTVLDRMEKVQPPIPDEQPIDSNVIPQQVTPNLIPQQVSPNLIPQQVSPNLMPQQVTPNVIPQQVTPKAPEDISSPNSNFSHQGSIKSISSQDYQRPLTSGPGDLRRQSSTPIIGSGSSQPIIQGPGDARRHSVKQSPRHRSPLSNNNISQFNDSPMDDFSRSNTVRTTSSSASNSIGIQLDARGRVKQDDMAEAFFENSRYASPNQQQIRPVGPPYNNTISSNAFSYGRGIPATHMPAQNSPVMNNRLPSSGTSATIVNNNPQLRTQYPQQQVYSNTGFYNVPYDPRRPPPQQQQPYNVYMGHQRPSNGLSVQRMDDGRQVLFLVKALYDYKTTSVEEISFLASDVIAVLGTNPDGWWEGELLDDSRKKRGLFPSNYIQILE